MDAEQALALLFLPGVGARSVLRALAGWPLALALTRRGLAAWRDPALRATAASRARDQVTRARDLGVHLLVWGRPGYPPALAAFPDPPPVLWVRGRLPAGPALAVVGTRAPTAFGLAAARALARACGAVGWAVVSGLALGVDAAAHRAALAAGAPTVAVLGGGVDRPYPPAHQGLAGAILAAGGALVSEQPLGTPVTPAGLVRRDRIQAGLALATAVCETAPDGGAMHAARAALAAGRPVLVPVPPAAPAHAAPSATLAGAAPCSGQAGAAPAGPAGTVPAAGPAPVPPAVWQGLLDLLACPGAVPLPSLALDPLCAALRALAPGDGAPAVTDNLFPDGRLPAF